MCVFATAHHFHFRDRKLVLTRSPEGFVEPLFKSTAKVPPRKLVPTAFGLVPVSDDDIVDPDGDLSEYEKSKRNKGKGKVVEDGVEDQR